MPPAEAPKTMTLRLMRSRLMILSARCLGLDAYEARRIASRRLFRDMGILDQADDNGFLSARLAYPLLQSAPLFLIHPLYFRDKPFIDEHDVFQ